MKKYSKFFELFLKIRQYFNMKKQIKGINFPPEKITYKHGVTIEVIKTIKNFDLPSEYWEVSFKILGDNLVIGAEDKNTGMSVATIGKEFKMYLTRF